MRFKFYVLNYDFNKSKVKMFNIFDNIRVQEETEKAVKKYLKNPKKFLYKAYMPDEEIYGFDGFVKEIDTIIMWQEWSRAEYEIGVGYAFEDDCRNFEKWDCYQQAHANIEIIAYEIIRQYKQQVKMEN